jgi:hypothetical protein
MDIRIAELSVFGYGCVVAQVVSLLDFPPWWPGFMSRQSMWVVWWTKQHWGRFSLSTSVSPANHHSTNFSIIIITWGWHYGPIGGHSAEWTQLDSTPHYTIPCSMGLLGPPHFRFKDEASMYVRKFSNTVYFYMVQMPKNCIRVNNKSS